MYPAGCATAIEVPIQVHIGQQKSLCELHPGKANAGQLARRAARAVAADQPLHAHRVAAAEHRRDAIPVLQDVDERRVPLRGATEIGEPVTQRRLDLRLRYQHRRGRGAQPGISVMPGLMARGWE